MKEEWKVAIFNWLFKGAKLWTEGRWIGVVDHMWLPNPIMKKNNFVIGIIKDNQKESK